jgi:hypothetical protein
MDDIHSGSFCEGRLFFVWRCNGEWKEEAVFGILWVKRGRIER